MIKAELVPQVITVYLNVKNIVSVDCSFIVGEHKMSGNNNIKVHVDLTDKLLQAIQSEIFPQLEEKFNDTKEKSNE